MNKYYFAVLICTAVVMTTALSVLHPVVNPNSDSVSYLKVMEALDGGDAASAGPLAYRIITTAGGLWTVIILSKLFGNYENAWIFMNIVFFFITVMVSYELVRRIQKSEKVALLSAMFLAGNYAMITFGLGYFMDIGGWMFYIASALGVHIYAQSGEQKSLWWAAVAVGIGGLFKEYAFLGAFLIGIYLIYENWRTPVEFFKKVWLPALIVAVPTLILHGTVFLKYHFTYLDWLASNQAHYVYASRTIEYIKTFGSLLNILGLLAVLGLFYFWKNRDKAFAACFFLSASPILFWPAITQRITFVSVPVAMIFASYLFRRFASRLYLFIPVLLVYIFTSLYMDSYILQAVNLPF